MVKVLIFGGFWAHLPRSSELDHAGRDIRVVELLTRLRIDPTEVGIVTVNGRQCKLDEMVPAGSRVYIFPPMAGG
jgi:molybdopterin converting factor small subunit